jgi:hypothetical protein
MSKFVVWLRDTGERMLRAVLVAVLPLIAVANVKDLNMWETAMWAALGAVVSFLLSLAAKFVGNGASSSFQADLPREQVVADPKVD